jgi:monolysocardiolipin acyltransferase
MEFRELRYLFSKQVCAPRYTQLLLLIVSPSRFLSTFFTLGQVLPTHRGAYSPVHGGLFQPTITQAIRLLSSQPFSSASQNLPKPDFSISPTSPDIIDPFTSSALTYPLTYTTTGTDTFPSPSAYTSRKFSWIHIFPEGCVHQHPQKSLRYFKWGISRLILEAEPMPEIVPIFVDGMQDVMPENRSWPRQLPRAGKLIKIAFGDSVDGEQVFGDLRARWKNLVRLQQEALRKKGERPEMEMGELTEGLMYGSEAVAIRKEVTRRVRMEVLKVRRSLGYPDEDPKQGLVETWIEEGPKKTGKMDDGSWVGET